MSRPFSQRIAWFWKTPPGRAINWFARKIGFTGDNLG